MLIINTIVLLIALYSISTTFRPYNKTFAYYKNYADFISGRKALQDYQSFFDRNVPRDYAIASFMKVKKDDTFFLWSDSGQIYMLSERMPLGRYIVAYHMTTNKDTKKETEEVISSQQPRYIIATKDERPIAGILKLYTLRYRLEGTNIYERVYEADIER